MQNREGVPFLRRMPRVPDNLFQLSEEDKYYQADGSRSLQTAHSAQWSHRRGMSKHHADG